MSNGDTDHGFFAEEWRGLSAGERVSRCRLMAEQAKSLAAQAGPQHRDGYTNLAREWLRLAAVIEREANLSSPAGAGPPAPGDKSGRGG